MLWAVFVSLRDNGPINRWLCASFVVCAHSRRPLCQVPWHNAVAHLWCGKICDKIQLGGFLFFVDQKLLCSVRFWGLWALGDLKWGVHVFSFNSHHVQMVWVIVLVLRDVAFNPSSPNFVFPSRCVTGCTRWNQTPQCCWPTPGSICSLTPWLIPQGPSLDSSYPLNCPLLTKRHFMTSWHNKLTSGFRSGFAVWCLSFSSKNINYSLVLVQSMQFALSIPAGAKHLWYEY